MSRDWQLGTSTEWKAPAPRGKHHPSRGTRKRQQGKVALLGARGSAAPRGQRAATFAIRGTGRRGTGAAADAVREPEPRTALPGSGTAALGMLQRDEPAARPGREVPLRPGSCTPGPAAPPRGPAGLTHLASGRRSAPAAPGAVWRCRRCPAPLPPPRRTRRPRLPLQGGAGRARGGHGHGNGNGSPAALPGGRRRPGTTGFGANTDSPEQHPRSAAGAERALTSESSLVVRDLPVTEAGFDWSWSAYNERSKERRGKERRGKREGKRRGERTEGRRGEERRAFSLHYFKPLLLSRLENPPSESEPASVAHRAVAAPCSAEGNTGQAAGTEKLHSLPSLPNCHYYLRKGTPAHRCSGSVSGFSAEMVTLGQQFPIPTAVAVDPPAQGPFPARGAPGAAPVPSQLPLLRRTWGQPWLISQRFWSRERTSQEFGPTTLCGYRLSFLIYIFQVYLLASK